MSFFCATAYPKILQCFDDFATVLANDVNCLAIRARFLAKVERALPEELEALDKGPVVWQRQYLLRDVGIPPESEGGTKGAESSSALAQHLAVDTSERPQIIEYIDLTL